jgi:hypothetical protein
MDHLINHVDLCGTTTNFLYTMIDDHIAGPNSIVTEQSFTVLTDVH